MSPGPHAEERLGEIVDALGALGALANDLVDLDPDQHAFVIVFLVAAQVVVRLRAAVLEDRIVGGVFDRAPFAAGLDRIVAGRIGDLAEHRVLGLDARAGGEDVAPELVLPFVDPQQAVLHRRAVIGRPQIGRAAVLAVPAVVELVSDDVSLPVLGLPLDEAFRHRASFRSSAGARARCRRAYPTARRGSHNGRSGTRRARHSLPRPAS